MAHFVYLHYIFSHIVMLFVAGLQTAIDVFVL